MSEKIAPHAYVPSAMHMGDCQICGHVQEAAIHLRIRNAADNRFYREPVATRLDRDQASDYLYQKFGIVRAPVTLAKLRCLGGGPVFFKVGCRVYYRPADPDHWAASITSTKVTTTAQLREPGHD
jgi:hypothetical protein